MEIEREAALCLFRRGDAFLVSALRDKETGAELHRPPGGGIEAGEAPEAAVRREIFEELGIELPEIQALGFIDHEWNCNGRRTRERAWIFLAAAAVDARLERGETPELIEADGQRVRTLWRGLDPDEVPLCPGGLRRLITV